ncbi:MAG: Single-stranded-DNA-specific exonuclease RecJ, partial [uncultured bacterium]
AAHPEWMMKFGGHAMAAGVTLQPALLADFSRAFDEVVSREVDDALLDHVILSDGALRADEFTLALATLLRDAGPWGQLFPEPLFEGVFEILEQRIVGDKHLKLKLRIDKQLIDGIAFFVDTNVWPNHRASSMRAAFRLDVNEYQGRKSVQVLIECMEGV